VAEEKISSDKFADTSTGSVQSLRQRAEEVLQQQPEELREMPPEDIQHLIHELQVHQIELEMQNEELRRIQRELELSRDRYSDLYDFAPVGYFTLSETGLILQANLTAATMLGVERGRLIKQPLSRFILSEDQDIYYLHRKQLFETREPQVCEMRMVRKDGSQFWAQIEAAMALDGEGQAVCRTAMSDITERKQAEERLEHLNLVLRAIGRVNQLIARERDRDGLLRCACDSLIETRGYYHAWITLLDEAGGLVTTAEAGLGKEFPPMVERLKRGELTACGRRALTQSEVVVTEDPPSACADCPLSATYGGRGAMTVRLEHGGKVYGLLSVSIPAHLTTDREEQVLFEEVARDIAFALHGIELEEKRKRAEEALQESEEQLRLVVQNMPIMLDALDADNNIIVWNQECKRVTGYSAKEIIGNPKALELLYPDTAYLQRVLAELGERGNDFRDWELELTSKEGSIKTVAWSNLSERFPIPGWDSWAVGVDITDRRRAEEELRQSYQKLQKALEGTVHALVSAIEMRDPYTAGHQRRVTQLACAIANGMGLPEEQIEGLRMAGLIHDVGKISVPAEVLSKPGRLHEVEYSLIKVHPQVGHDVLKDMDFPWPLAQIVLQHHERLDGSGYPHGLSDGEIMLEARILAVADVVEAMVSHRPHRPAHSIDKALEEIAQNRGVLYDPKAVDACLKLFTEDGFTFE
jgi:PAS domain S-box-containing protein